MKSLVLAIGAWLLVTATAGTSVAITPQQQLVQRFRKAVAAGKDADAMKRICYIPVPDVDVAGGGRPEYMEDFRKLWHRRYDRAFKPPSNADSLAPGGWAGVIPSFVFARDGVASIESGEGSNGVRWFFPWPAGEKLPPPDSMVPPDHCFMLFQYEASPFVTIDLDRDGTSDVSFDGKRCELSPLLHQIAETSPGDPRAQWLVGPLDADLRIRPSLWIYRDGCYFDLFLDTDGDGRGNCGVGGRIPD